HEKPAPQSPPPSTAAPADVAHTAPERPPPGSLGAAALEEALLGRWAAERRESRDLAKDAALWPVPLLGTDEHRARVLRQ
ncbi:acyl-CoA dehydrogenase, partial [Micrococcus sp. SIMBA_131]